MKRIVPFCLFFVVSLPVGCAGFAEVSPSNEGEGESAGALTNVPVIPKNPISHLPLEGVNVCSASSIAWTPNSATNQCAGGFEYRPYAAPCYNGSNVPTPSCGPVTGWGKTSCNYPSNCRLQKYGVEQTIPDRTDVYSLHVQSLSDGYDYCNETIPNYSVAPWIPLSAYDFTFGTKAVNWGAPEGTATMLHPVPGFAPDSTNNPNGPGTVTCRLYWSHMALYNTFEEYNDNTTGGRLNGNDPADNSCPIDPKASPCFENPIYPTCSPSTAPVQAPLGLDADRSACGSLTNSYTYSGAQTQFAFNNQFKSFANQPADLSCTSCEDKLIDDPSALTAGSAAKAQAKLDAIVSRLKDVSSGRAPATTFNAALKSKLTGEMKLLAELEGQLLTPAQRDVVWQADLTSDDQESCEPAAIAAPAPPAAACPAAPVPSGITSDFATYIRRGLSACSNFQQDYASIPATATFAPRCFALAKTIPVDGFACQTTPGPGPTPIPINDLAKAKTAAVSNLKVPICMQPDVLGGTTSSIVACSYKSYRNAYRDVANALITKLIRAMKVDSNSESTDAIQATLVLIEQWYEGMATFYPPGSDRTQLWADTSAVIGVFWNVVLSSPFANATANLTSNNPNLNVSNQFLSDATEAIRKVFVAAFTPVKATSGPPPLHGAPLMYLMSDGVQTITNRLEYVGLFHDLGCRFKGCIGGTVETEIAQMWRVLSKLADGNALTAELKNDKKLRVQWAAVFADMALSHQTTIEPAVMDAWGVTSYTPSLLATGGATTLPTPLLSVSNVIQRATTHSANYVNGGLLGSNATNTIDIGLQNSTLGTASGATYNLTGEIGKLQNDLQTALPKYEAAQAATISNILGQLTNAQKSDQLQSQLASAEAQFTHLTREMAALQESDARSQMAFGQFMDAYNGVMKGDSIDDTGMVKRTGVTTTIDPLSAGRGSGASWGDIRQIAAPPSGGATVKSPLVASRGWMLNVDTTGTWTPTCALRATNLPGGKAGVGGDATPTGPEGYYVTLSNQSYTAVSNTESLSAGTSESVNSSVKDCSGVKAEGGFSVFGNGAQAYNDTSYCMSYDTSLNISASFGVNTNNGQEGRTSASFSYGIRLPNTPFPNAPAGALLLVEMNHNGFSPGDIVDVRVVQKPSMSVLLDADVDVYFVDNDISGCSYTQPGALTLQIAELQPLPQALIPIGDAMVLALKDVKSWGNGVIAQGKVLPDNMAEVRQLALSELTAKTPAGVVVPPSLQALFNAYVEEAIVHVERLVEIAADDYQRSLISISLKGIQDDIAANANQARYYQLLTAYSLVNLDADALTAVLTPLLGYVMNELYPAALIRYPEAITSIQQKAVTQLDELTTNLDWTSVDVKLVTQAGLLVQTIEQIFEDSAFRSSPQTPSTNLVLAFVNPDFKTVGLDGSPYASKWPAADSATARAVWNAVNAGTVASITPTPELLYGDNRDGLLACGRIAPIIDHIALFVGAPTSTTTTLDTVTANGGVPARLHVGDAQAYTSQTGLLLYHFLDPAWLDSSEGMYVIGGDPAFTLQTFATKAVATFPANFTGASGLSPFSTFNIDMSPVKTLLAKMGQQNVTANEIDLVMEVESNGVHGDLTWISSCKSQSSGSSSGPKQGTTSPPILVNPGGGTSSL